MKDNKERQMETLRNALAIEVKEKGYYQAAAASSVSPLAKKLFERLATEEDEHAKRFKAIEVELGKGRGWPDIEAPAWEGEYLKKVISSFNNGAAEQVKVGRSELDAMQAAMANELRAYDMYRTRASETDSEAEKKFYNTLAGEERVHHLSLLDSYEYLTDPAGWFTVKERWTIEG
jgi:rubrerythrin